MINNVGAFGLRLEGVIGYLDFPRDVTAQTREAAYQAYCELARAQVQVLSMNFTASDYVNSAGIGLVISLVEDATQAGRRVYAYGLTSHYRKLFGMVGLTERITLAQDEAEVKRLVGVSADAAPPESSPPA